MASPPSKSMQSKYIIQNAGLNESQSGIKIAGRNISNNRYAAVAKSLQSCPTLCDPIDGSLPGSSIHGIFQARVLEWGAIAFSIKWLRRVLHTFFAVNFVIKYITKKLKNTLQFYFSSRTQN